MEVMRIGVLQSFFEASESYVVSRKRFGIIPRKKFVYSRMPLTTYVPEANNSHSLVVPE